jgi:hypothetical protein
MYIYKMKIFLLLTVFLMFKNIYAVSQYDCGSNKLYCCDKVDGPYPRGYVGTGCTEISNLCNKPKHNICCQQLQKGTAYYCGNPK